VTHDVHLQMHCVNVNAIHDAVVACHVKSSLVPRIQNSCEMRHAKVKVNAFHHVPPVLWHPFYYCCLHFQQAAVAALLFLESRVCV
jgi:hypothetical protein